MRARIEIVRDLIHLKGKIASIKRELTEYPWDCEEPLVVMNEKDMIEVLEKAILQSFSPELIEEWANTIECRDDIDFETEDLKEAIHELSNPALFGIIDDTKIEAIIRDLSA